MKLQNGIIRLQKYEFDPRSILGKGSTGNVYKGYRLKDGGRVAIKAIDMTQISNDITRYLLQGEKTAMMTVKSPFVLKAEDIIQGQHHCYIAMEMCTGGTLKQYIKMRGKLQQHEALDLFRKILTGYVSIIDSKIIHRDLKTANIMLRADNSPAIIDFGYCQMIFGKRPFLQYNVGSPSYMSPEAFSKSMYSEKSDVWALGIILHQMLTGKPLDSGRESADYFAELWNYKIAPYKYELFSETVRAIFDKCLVVRPQERATSMKVKYIVDKAMIGKLPPLNADGKPMVIPNLQTKKLKTQPVQHDTVSKNILRNEPKERLKPRFSFLSPQPKDTLVNSIYIKERQKSPIPNHLVTFNAPNFSNHKYLRCQDLSSQRLYSRYIEKNHNPQIQLNQSSKHPLGHYVTDSCVVRFQRVKTDHTTALTPINASRKSTQVTFTMENRVESASGHRTFENQSPFFFKKKVQSPTNSVSSFSIRRVQSHPILTPLRSL